MESSISKPNKAHISRYDTSQLKNTGFIGLKKGQKNLIWEILPWNFLLGDIRDVK